MNQGIEIGFDRPAWVLWTLLGVWVILIMLIWLYSFRALSGLGNWRRIFALSLRTLVVTILVLALANTQWRKSTDRLTVFFLLDHSESIPKEKREYMLDYVASTVSKHRRENRADLAGIVVFGANAKIEVAPYDGDLPLIGNIESAFDLQTDATNLEAAIKLAKASFPEDTARRIVIISDGNENLGDARTFAQNLADDGIGIDVIPVHLLARSEISVERVDIPADIRKGQEFEARIIINNDTTPTPDNPQGIVKARLSVFQRAGRSGEVLPLGDGEDPTMEIVLKPGKNIRSFKHKLDRSAVYTFDAHIEPENKADDFVSKNNTATAFTHVRGKGRVLLIVEKELTTEYVDLTGQLRKNNIEVDLMAMDSLFESSSELMQYDCVVLGNVPRSTGDDINSSFAFSDSQIRMLVRNTEDIGCGLVMLGGPNALGAGGWANTELEAAVPVDFHIKNDKVAAVGALVMVMHASEMDDGNFWQQKVSKEALKVLGPMDYCGVVEWSNFGATRWLWSLPNGIDRIYQNKKFMMSRLDRLTPGDMPDFAPSMELALSGFTRSGFNPSMKHMIIISDGDPTPPSRSLVQKFIDNEIKITTVAIGYHSQPKTLIDLAVDTGGKFFDVKNNGRALPRIFQREARRVSKPLIKENPNGIGIRATSLAGAHPILQGIDLAAIQPVRGYVMTTRKENSLVEQLLVADQPSDDGENSTILATWQLGAGRATVLTTDAGYQWADSWRDSSYYDKLFSQAIRHAMRPIKESANFTVATEINDGKAKVVVTAMDDNDEFLNFLDMQARGLNPQLDGFDLGFEQVSPGRYEAEFDARKSGNYLFSIFPGEGMQRLTAGISVPYSTEFSVKESDFGLLNSLAEIKPKGGEQGVVIDGDVTRNSLEQLLRTDTFRGTLTTTVGIRDIWPQLLVICAFIFLGDVFVRRVAINFSWVGTALDRLKHRLTGAERVEVTENIGRLQSRKDEIQREFDAKTASTRFAPIDEAETGADVLAKVLERESKRFDTPGTRKQDIEPEADEQSYTSRLLDAKRRAQRRAGTDESDHLDDPD